MERHEKIKLYKYLSAFSGPHWYTYLIRAYSFRLQQALHFIKLQILNRIWHLKWSVLINIKTIFGLTKKRFFLRFPDMPYDCKYSRIKMTMHYRRYISDGSANKVPVYLYLSLCSIIFELQSAMMKVVGLTRQKHSDGCIKSGPFYFRIMCYDNNLKNGEHRILWLSLGNWMITIDKSKDCQSECSSDLIFTLIFIINNNCRYTRFHNYTSTYKWYNAVTQYQ